MPVRPRHVEKVRHAYGVMRRGIRKLVLTIIDQFDTQASSYTAASVLARDDRRRVTPAAVRERRPDPLRPRTSHDQPWPVPLYKEGPPSAEVHRRTHLAPIGVPCSSSLTLARTSRDPFEICHVRLR